MKKVMRKRENLAKYAGKLLCALLVLALAAGVCGPLAARAEETEETEYVEKLVTFDFTDCEGDSIADTPLVDYFVPDIVAAAGGVAEVIPGDVLQLTSYATFYLDVDNAYDLFSGAYVFSLDYQFKSTSSTLGGIFLRATDPGAYTITNPKNSGVSQAFNFYEWDWYKENSGKADGESCIGGSGIRIYDSISSSKLGINIKTYEEDGLHVYARKVLFNYPKSYRAGEMNNFRFIDDGKGVIQILVNNELLCTVEYGGEPGAYPDGDDGSSSQLFYKEASVKDPEGNVLLSVDNARISAEYSMVAVGSRGDAVSLLDNVVISWMEKKKAATPEPTATERVIVTAAPATDVPTEAPATGEASKPSGGGLSTNAIIYIACGAVAVIAVAIIAITAIKKKKK